MFFLSILLWCWVNVLVSGCFCRCRCLRRRCLRDKTRTSTLPATGGVCMNTLPSTLINPRSARCPQIVDSRLGSRQGARQDPRQAVRRAEPAQPRQDLPGVLHVQPGAHLQHEEAEVGPQQQVRGKGGPFTDSPPSLACQRLARQAGR